MGGANVESVAKSASEITRSDNGVLADENDVHEVLNPRAGAARMSVCSRIRVHLLGDLPIEGNGRELNRLHPGERQEAGSRQHVQMLRHRIANPNIDDRLLEPSARETG